MLSLYQASQRERAAVAALQQLPKEMRRELRDVGRDAITPLLVREASRLAHGTLLKRLVGTGRYRAYRDTPGVKFGGSRPITASGVPARVLARAVEFGSAGRRTATYQQKRGGRQVPVTRRTTRQFMPDTGARGRAISPAAEAINDEGVQLWLDKVEELLLRAFDGGR